MSDDLRRRLEATGRRPVPGPDQAFADGLETRLLAVAASLPPSSPPPRRTRLRLLLGATLLAGAAVALVIAIGAGADRPIAPPDLEAPVNTEVALVDGTVLEDPDGLRLPEGAVISVGEGGSARVGDTAPAARRRGHGGAGTPPGGAWPARGLRDVRESDADTHPDAIPTPVPRRNPDTETHADALADCHARPTPTVVEPDAHARARHAGPDARPGADARPHAFALPADDPADRHADRLAHDRPASAARAVRCPGRDPGDLDGGARCELVCARGHGLRGRSGTAPALPRRPCGRPVHAGARDPAALPGAGRDRGGALARGGSCARRHRDVAEPGGDPGNGRMTSDRRPAHPRRCPV